MGIRGSQRRTLFGTPKQQAVGSTPAGFTNWIKAARSGKEFDENPERALF